MMLKRSTAPIYHPLSKNAFSNFGLLSLFGLAACGGGGGGGGNE